LLRIIHRGSNERSDEALLELYRTTGDLEPLGELYNKYMHLVYGLCLRYLESREDSRDAVILIFERLAEEIPRHEIRNFKSWLYVLSKNYCLMLIRSRKLKDRKQGIWVIEQESSVEFQEELHPMDREGQEMDERLQACIERLKAEQKDCIRLFYFQNWSYRQIAEILHMEEKKVKSHLQNAKRNLKICLEEQDVKEK
jgi:RNA polymerase sigma-70 factor (ECF subfamily)